MKTIILTGNEIRHEYSNKKVASDTRIKVLSSFWKVTVDALI